MKKSNVFLVFGILLLTAAVFSSGCKKKSTAVVPAFTIPMLSLPSRAVMQDWNSWKMQ